jgi:hypothetical protein
MNLSFMNNFLLQEIEKFALKARKSSSVNLYELPLTYLQEKDKGVGGG